jgi:hypothetical protein
MAVWRAGVTGDNSHAGILVADAAAGIYHIVT